jgi:uncharacterized ion transporter superfamily protein YfcC
MEEALKNNETVEMPKEEGLSHPFMALVIMVMLVAIATHFVPAGEFERVMVNGRSVVDPSTFKLVESNPTSIAGFFQSFYLGFKKATGIMGLVFFIGGAFGVLKGIGLLNIAVRTITDKVKHKGIILIAPICMIAILLNSGFTGMRELDVIFITLLIPVCLSLGYDTMTALGVVLLGSAAGFAPAMANPFFTGIAHKIAELPIYSAMGYRGMITLFMFVTGVAYVVWYGNKVKKDPNNSVLKDLGSEIEKRNLYASGDGLGESVKMTGRMMAAGIVFLGLFAFMVYGTLKLGYGFTQMSGIFVAMTILSGLIAGLNPNKICDYWANGCSEVLVAVLIIFFARSILVLLEDAKIIDTIIHWMSGFIIGSSSTISAVVVYILQNIINFIIPSGSGQAVITMPIIIPLADMGGITRQVACLASQLGDGLTNYIYPTNGTLMAVLALAKVPWSKWYKWFIPLFIFWSIANGIFVAVAQMIGLGPF